MILHPSRYSRDGLLFGGLYLKKTFLLITALALTLCSCGETDIKPLETMPSSASQTVLTQTEAALTETLQTSAGQTVTEQTAPSQTETEQTAPEQTQTEQTTTEQTTTEQTTTEQTTSKETRTVTEKVTEAPKTEPKQKLPHEQHYCYATALCCLDNGEILYSHNLTSYTAPASLTKLLTTLVMLNYLGADDVITVGNEVTMVQPYSSLCWLAAGQRIKVRDLVKGMLMCSGNDAAYVAAVNTARAYKGDSSISDQEAVKIFVGLMNDYAAKLKMYDSKFVNPEGWDNDAQHTTVADLIKLASHAAQNSVIREAVKDPKTTVYFLSGGSYEWTNTNYLLDPSSPYYMSGAYGMKTGTTSLAGKCLISLFTVNGKSYLNVMVGAQNDDDRFYEAHSARDYVLSMQ